MLTTFLWMDVNARPSIALISGKWLPLPHCPATADYTGALLRSRYAGDLSGNVRGCNCNQTGAFVAPGLHSKAAGHQRERISLRPKPLRKEFVQ